MPYQPCTSCFHFQDPAPSGTYPNPHSGRNEVYGLCARTATGGFAPVVSAGCPEHMGRERVEERIARGQPIKGGGR